MIDLIIKSSGNVAKIVSLIRNYNSGLSVGEIRKRIENQEVLLTHDISDDVDICDELNGVDKNKMFLKLIEDVKQNGGYVELYEDSYLISYEIVCNMIQRWNEIGEQTERDIQRELGLEDEDE